MASHSPSASASLGMEVASRLSLPQVASSVSRYPSPSSSGSPTSHRPSTSVSWPSRLVFQEPSIEQSSHPSLSVSEHRDGDAGAQSSPLSIASPSLSTSAQAVRQEHDRSQQSTAPSPSSSTPSKQSTSSGAP